MTDDPKTSEAKEAARKELAEQVLATAEKLEQLLKGQGGLDAGYNPLEDPAFQLHALAEERLKAEAAILEELCDIVIPEAALSPQRMRKSFSSTPPTESVAELEAFCGALSARKRESEWLDAPAMRLSGDMDLMGATDGARDGDTGLFKSQEYWVLLDGRFAEVHVLGTWRVTGKLLNPTRNTITSTRLLSAHEVARNVDLPDVFMALRSWLHSPVKIKDQQHVPDLAERLARFDAILQQYTSTVTANTDELRRVGDSPA